MLKRIVFIAMTSFALSACSTLAWVTGEEGESATGSAHGSDAPKSKVALKTSSNDELELQIARLSSRINELEVELNRQKERGKLIEKGLLLGLVPDELKSEGVAEVRPSDHGHGEDGNHGGGQKLSAVKLLEVKAPSEPKNEGSRDREQYRKMIQAAQDKFNRANYGQAITAYNEISAKFDDSITEGSQHYWIGLSWYYLKEYKLSEESFQALQSRFPASPWVPHAGFYLAKVDQSRGFQQKALEQFQKILDENPSRDLGEMAQSEIERMKERL
ncbi:MAG: hypothetical protein V4655_08015 [Bdellovibrionota bacterium]